VTNAGPTVIDSGTLQIGADNALSAGSLTINGVGHLDLGLGLFDGADDT